MKIKSRAAVRQAIASYEALAATATNEREECNATTRAAAISSLFDLTPKDLLYIKRERDAMVQKYEEFVHLAAKLEQHA